MNTQDLKKELKFKAVKSSGSGGQHVNKVATKAVLYFNVWDSKVLNDTQKQRIKKVLQKRINSEGILSLSSSSTRSQLKNKSLVIERFFLLLSIALKDSKKRIPTKIPKLVRQQRLDSKRKNAKKKSNRKPPKID